MTSVTGKEERLEIWEWSRIVLEWYENSEDNNIKRRKKIGKVMTAIIIKIIQWQIHKRQQENTLVVSVEYYNPMQNNETKKNRFALAAYKS